MSLLNDLTLWLQKARKPLVVLLGPTASGKTTFSIQLAQALTEEGRCAEVINADSRQLYHSLDIGTAKITEQEMQGIPHHLLSVLDPKEEVTAPWYKERAEDCIQTILAQGHLPLLVGGSMLYISAIVDNLQFVEKPPPLLRKHLSERYDRDQGKALYRELQARDPEAALSIDPRNKVYLLRALEVSRTTEKYLHEAKTKLPCPFDLFLIGIDLPRAELHRRITERTEQMFRAGWAEEVASLLQRGYASDDPGLKSHGYREIAAALARHPVKEVKQDSALRQAIAAKTRQFARRQMTWWRGDERIRWITVA